MYTSKQKLLYEKQEEDPLFYYYNPVTNKYNFGFIWRGRADVYTTLSLRPLLEKGMLIKTEEYFTIDVESYKLKDIRAERVVIIPDSDLIKSML
jgi:hypothetical protein